MTIGPLTVLKRKKKEGDAGVKQGKLFIQMDGAMISQVRTGGLKKNYLYLDTCTTNDQMVNPSYLTGVHTAKDPLNLHTNAGTSTSRQQGFMGSKKFWLDRMGIANVISLASLEEDHAVSYDSRRDGGSFVVHTGESDIVFKRCPDTGFPFIDLDDVTHGDKGAILVQAVSTVRENYEGFTKRDVLKARAAKELQSKLGYASDTTMKDLLKEKEKVRHALLHNCPVTIDDFEKALTIFGPSVARLKGTSTRTKPIRAEADYVRIPQEIVDLNRFITIVADVMFVCGLPFLISLSRRIRFVTLQYIPNRTAGELCAGIKSILKLYKRAGFVVPSLG